MLSVKPCHHLFHILFCFWVSDVFMADVANGMATLRTVTETVLLAIPKLLAVFRNLPHQPNNTGLQQAEI